MRYWVYLDGEVPSSPYAPEELAALPGFEQVSMVCPVEGAPEARNWRRAGEFPELLDALQARRLSSLPAPAAPAPKAPAPEPARPLSADDVLNDASARIFLHVSDLMRELENRREERALTQTLQRQVAELRSELLAARERIAHLDERARLLPAFEDRERMLQAEIARARAELRERGAELSTALDEIPKLKAALEEQRRRAEEGEAEAARFREVSSQLSAQLSEKELALAKAFAVVRRLEQTLCDLIPSATAGISREVPDLAPPEEDVPQAPAPEQAPAQAPPEGPAAQEEPQPEAADLEPHVLEAEPRPESSLPPEGEVRPVPRPWRTLLKKAFENLKPPPPPPPETQH